MKLISSSGSAVIGPAVKRIVRSALSRFGYSLVRNNGDSREISLLDLTKKEREIVNSVLPFTMTSVERIAALIHAVNYLVRNQIPGDIAECGVWRGGSMMAVAMTLQSLGDTGRKLYLYDTFEGMSAPTERDCSFSGQAAQDIFDEHVRKTQGWCDAGLDEVRRNLLASGYPPDKFVFIQGKVEDTIPAEIPSSLSLLRLDTDWYESTRHELLHLYPLLSSAGVLIIDDYGYWQGARAAVDEYFGQFPNPVFLHRIDSTGRIVVKTQQR